jgi:hypothetical protein
MYNKLTLLDHLPQEERGSGAVASLLAEIEEQIHKLAEMVKVNNIKQEESLLYVMVYVFQSSLPVCLTVLNFLFWKIPVPLTRYRLDRSVVEC